MVFAIVRFINHIVFLTAKVQGLRIRFFGLRVEICVSFAFCVHLSPYSRESLRWAPCSHRCGVAVAELGPGGDGESEGGRARARISESGICVIPC